MVLFAILPIVFISSFLLTLLIRSYAIKKSIIDIPNVRSSHNLPTPRGGGLSFVIVFLLSVLIVKTLNFVPIHIENFELLSFMIIAVLGFVDDKYSLSPLLRLVIQLLAVLVFFVPNLPIPPLVSNLIVITPGFFLNTIMIFYLIWLLNLYNFMDGINGIASLEAISVLFGMYLVYWFTGNLALSPTLLFLIAAILGFLPWNFPVAKIFMGDVGSGFLGFVIGILSLQAFVINSQLFWSWLVLLGVFIVDATLTLLIRTISGNKIYQAHCTHAYQHSARKLGNHAPITLIVTAINIFWLLPIAVITGLRYIDGFYGLLIAYLPLVFISIKLGAGR